MGKRAKADLCKGGGICAGSHHSYICALISEVEKLLTANLIWMEALRGINIGISTSPLSRNKHVRSSATQRTTAAAASMHIQNQLNSTVLLLARQRLSVSVPELAIGTLASLVEEWITKAIWPKSDQSDADFRRSDRMICLLYTLTKCCDLAQETVHEKLTLQDAVTRRLQKGLIPVHCPLQNVPPVQCLRHEGSANEML